MTARLFATLVVGTVLPGFAAQATLYTDTAGEQYDGGQGFPHLDIVSVEILNDATDISFTVNLTGDPIATDWGKYLVAIDSGPGGDTASNGWGRPISMSSGMDYWIGTWVDSGNGAETYSWDGAVWNLDNATYNPPSDIGPPITTTSSLTFSTSLASLGLAISDTFIFDVFVAGGGATDSANDALSDPNMSIADWGGPYNSTSALSYTVVPEPATFTMILVGLGAMVIRKIRRR
jgi:hypothetical protein